jgi:hypothetical protein
MTIHRTPLVGGIIIALCMIALACTESPLERVDGNINMEQSK